MRRRLKEAWGVSASVVPSPSLATSARSMTPPAHLPDVVAAATRESDLGTRLSARAGRVRLGARADGRDAAPPDEGIRQLLHMSLANYAAGAIMMPYGRSSRARGASLFDRPAVRRIWRERRAGRAPVHNAGPPGGAGRPLLHAAGRSGREHLQALRRRKLPLLAFRRHLPALEPARRLPDAWAGDHARSSKLPTASDTSPSAGRSSVRSSPKCRTGYLRSASAAISVTRTSCLAPTVYDSPKRRPAGRTRLHDLPPRATVPIARLRRRAGCWRWTGRRRSISPYPFVQFLGRYRFALERGAIPPREVSGGLRRQNRRNSPRIRAGSSDARTSA